MAKKKVNERYEKYQRILRKNQDTVPTARHTAFYALVDVRADKGTSTIVIDGETRQEAIDNALTEIEVNGWKANIAAVYPVAS